MEELYNMQITIFMLVAVGFFVRRREMVSQEAQKCLTDLFMYVILPCNILRAFWMDFTLQMGQELFSVLMLSIGVQILAVIYGKIMFRREPEGRGKCLRYATICSNAGFLGNAIAEGIYGSYGLLLASFFLIPVRIMMWTEGISIFSGSKNYREAMKKAATHPCIVFCMIGLVMMLTGWRFPAPLAKTVNYLGSCNTAVSMMIIGMILGKMKWSMFLDKTAWIYCIHRLVIMPLIIYVIAGFFHVSDVARGLVVILTAMPAGATTSILAAKYEQEPEFATKLVMCTTLLSLPSLAVWSMILH